MTACSIASASDEKIFQPSDHLHRVRRHYSCAKPRGELANLWGRCATQRLGRSGHQDLESERQRFPTPVCDETGKPAKRFKTDPAAVDPRTADFIPGIPGTRFRRNQCGYGLRYRRGSGQDILAETSRVLCE